MAEIGDLRVSRLLVGFLRLLTGMTQLAFGEAARVNQSLLSRYETTNPARAKLVPQDHLRRLAATARVPWPLVLLLRRLFAVFLTVLDAWTGREAEEPVGPLAASLAEVVDLAAFSHRFESLLRERSESTPEQERRAAEALWEVLEPLPLPEIRQLLEQAPRAASNWALAERISHASARRTADDAEAALELAQLALSIAEQVPGERPSARTSGYCLFDLANCQRVANDFDAADRSFERAKELWQAGAGAEAPPLAAWRPLHLEASLRRAQHRYSEALDLLERARKASEGDAEAAGRILLQKEHILAQQGDPEGAVAVLAVAAPLLEGSRERRLLFAVHFNTADNLARLGRHAAAEPFLLEARALVGDKKLDRIRVRWLGARVDAGLGRRDEAITALEEVYRFFLDEAHFPYDAALACLDLAVLRLEAGETAAVRELALAMGPIFKAQGIEREALAALTLFCEAARAETATVELARQAAADMEQATRCAPPAAKKPKKPSR